jgi:hypothetical protein
MGLIKRKKCRHCNRLFIPDARNAKRQKYCSQPACRKASKASSQQRWLQKPENKNYFCGSDHVERVQRWRKAHPGYWRRRLQKRQDTLQDPLISQHAEINADKGDFATHTLQDLLIEQPAVLIGLISNFTGTALQDDIANTVMRLQKLGRDIINPLPADKGGGYDCQTSHQRPQTAQGAKAVQLGRSSSGP